MVKVRARFSFDHNRTAVKRGDTLTVSEQVALDLERNKLVDRVHGPGGEVTRPSGVSGAKSSASPADPASLQTTAKKSGSGGTKANQGKSDGKKVRGAPEQKPAEIPSKQPEPSQMANEEAKPDESGETGELSL